MLCKTHILHTMVTQIISLLSDKVSEGWNMIDTTYVRVNGLRAIVSRANDEDKRQYRFRGRWIYPGVLVVEFNDNLYRVVLWVRFSQLTQRTLLVRRFQCGLIPLISMKSRYIVVYMTFAWLKTVRQFS